MIWNWQQVRTFLTNWKKLNIGSLNSRIFSAALTVALMTGLVKVAAAGKELVVAWQFGTGDALDAFLIAWLVPSFIVAVVASSFDAAFVPTYIQVREREGIEAAQKLFSGVIIWSLGLLGATTILMILTAQLYLPLLAQGFSRQKLDLTYHLLYILAPVVPLNGIAVLWGATLNAGERFAIAAISPVLSPVITIILLLTNKTWGIFALAGGVVCGVGLEMVLLGAALKQQGISVYPRWYGFNSHLRQVANQYAPMVAGSFLMSSTSLVDQSMAAMLSPGSVAALNYGTRLIAFPISLAATALSTAVIPFFSKMVASDDWLGLNRTLKRFIGIVFLLSIPLAGIFFAFSEFLVKIFFERGSFTPESTQIVGRIQAFYSLQIPFYVGGILVVRGISAIRCNHVLMWGALISLILNIVLNYLFMQSMGVAGIALSTSCVYAVSFLFLSWCWVSFLKNVK